jgi:hypothetical protein
MKLKITCNKWLSAVALIVCCQFEQALAVEDGHWLLAQCEQRQEACIHYINGVLSGTTMAMAVTSGKTGITLPAAYQAFLNICVPANQGVSISQQIDTAIAYLNQHPDELNQPAAGLVVISQQQAWPCKGNVKGP